MSHEHVYGICSNKCLVPLNKNILPPREIQFSTDLNDCTEEGWYICPNDFIAAVISNTPRTLYGAFTMLVTKAPNAQYGSEEPVKMIHRMIFEMRTDVENPLITGGKKPIVYFSTYNITTHQASDWISIGDFSATFNDAQSVIHIEFGENLYSIDLGSLKPDAMGGLSLVKIPKSEFDELPEKDPMTIYYVYDDNNKITQYMGDTKLAGGSAAAGNVMLMSSGLTNGCIVGIAEQVEDPQTEGD